MDKQDMDKKESDFDVEKTLNNNEHRENISRGSSQDIANPFDYEKLSYGTNGFKGMIQSPYVFGAAFLASLGGFSFGYDQGVISLILTTKQFHTAYPQTAPGHANQSFYTGFATAMLELGAFFGCLFYPAFADRFSRKWGLSMATSFFVVGAIIQTASPDYATLVAGRTIGGIGVGTLAAGAPLYITEIAPPNLRGSLLVLEQFSIVIGAITAYWITYGTKEINSSWSFRLPFLLQMIPAIIVGTMIHFFPFTPRWLSMRNRNDEALASIAKLRRLPADDERVQLEWKGIMAEVSFQRVMDRKLHGDITGWRKEFHSWLELVQPRYIKRTIVACGMAFFNQFVGINAFVYYAPTFFNGLGQSESNTLILSGIINIGQGIGITITTLYIDRIGRRFLAIYGALAMAAAHAVLAGLVGTYAGNWESHQAAGWVAVAFVYFFVIMFGLSYGPLCWAMPAEVFPNAVRAKGVGLAIAINWLSNFVIGWVVPPMFTSIGYGTYIFFACFCFMAFVFSFFLVPETSGKSLEQIDELFGDNNTAAEEEARREVLGDMH